MEEYNKKQRIDSLMYSIVDINIFHHFYELLEKKISLKYTEIIRNICLL